MQPDLLGYTLNALDPDEQRGVEDYLRSHPEAIARVQELRQSLEPLSLDRRAEPPAGLAERTLARVAAVEVTPKASKEIGVSGMPWRRILSMAAMLLVAVTAGGAGLAWVSGLRNPRPGGPVNAVQVTECKENLHKTWVSLWSYASTHNNQFPTAIADGKELPNANKVFSALKDGKVLPADLQCVCPASNGTDCYAYSLGYCQNGKLIGPRLEDGKPTSLMPLMADSPPGDPMQNVQSASHGGGGQNVLYSDGHVSYCTSRFVGYNQDDIYLNRHKQVAAGVEWSDAVLTSGNGK